MPVLILEQTIGDSVSRLPFLVTFLKLPHSLFTHFPLYSLGDYLPDKLAIHLPSSMTVKSVYDRMCEERITTTSVVSRAQFYNLWKEYYPHVTIPTVRITYCIVVLLS